MAMRSALSILAPSIVMARELQCDTSKNFISGQAYSQVELTDSCDNAGVCDSNPTYGQPMTFERATAYCDTLCNGLSGCTGFFFQKHNNGHEICGLYSSMLDIDSALFVTGHQYGAICSAPQREYECTTNKNYIKGHPYTQIDLTEPCSSSGLCDSKSKYGLPMTLDRAIDFCKAGCTELTGCTGFFFQKHSNGHEICGFYHSPLETAAWQLVDGYKYGAICVADFEGEGPEILEQEENEVVQIIEEVLDDDREDKMDMLEEMFEDIFEEAPDEAFVEDVVEDLIEEAPEHEDLIREILEDIAHLQTTEDARTDQEGNHQVVEGYLRDDILDDGRGSTEALEAETHMNEQEFTENKGGSPMGLPTPVFGTVMGLCALALVALVVTGILMAKRMKKRSQGTAGENEIIITHKHGRGFGTETQTVLRV